MAHAHEVAHTPPFNAPVLEPASGAIEPYHPTLPWYERWKLPAWIKKALSAKKALSNTSIQANKRSGYALSTRNPNWAQRGLRWLKAKWQQWRGNEPPPVFDEMDATLQTGGALADDAGEILEDFDLKPGGGYHPETIKNALSGSVLQGTLKPKTLGIGALVSTVQNAITYGFGSKKHLGLQSPEFLTSTLVDFGTNTLLGLATAGIVAGMVAFAPVTFSVSAVGAAGLVVGIGVSFIWSKVDKALGEAVSGQEGLKWTDWLKQRWAQQIRQAGQDAGGNNAPENWPDTPDGLAP